MTAPQLFHSHCDVPCPGNPAEVCGGEGAVSVYRTYRYRCKFIRNLAFDVLYCWQCSPPVADKGWIARRTTTRRMPYWANGLFILTLYTINLSDDDAVVLFGSYKYKSKKYDDKVSAMESDFEECKPKLPEYPEKLMDMIGTTNYAKDTVYSCGGVDENRQTGINKMELLILGNANT